MSTSPVSVPIPLTQQESEFLQNLLVKFRNEDPLISQLEVQLVASILTKLQAAQSQETPS